ncbi:rhodanese-like domain-containing protein [Neobacillus notoginsengisoli]|uniref:Rhodanese-like domain-containing protein n=1 Tax=Neobacillus notoginsengisoli TaxID=1578198 RepID=A0A417YWL1_9BACI|nr:rhodanese-like domain-containing protein [Neobacillus notoginsengisoli]RHW41704.1 rhodanese-like domain-containing protein [Neobacillus notoginsengisoli]
MDYLNWLLIGITGFFLLKQFLPAKGVRNIGVAELKPMLKDQAIQFVDVRNPGEFRDRHIHEFKNIPLHQLSQKASQLNKEKEVVVICQSGMRSSKAARQLKILGFNNITNVKGGMSAWL